MAPPENTVRAERAVWTEEIALTGVVIRTEQTLPRGREQLRFVSGQGRRTAAGEPLAVEYDVGEEYFASALLLRLRARLAWQEAALERAGSGTDAGLPLRELREVRRAAALGDAPGLMAAGGRADAALFPGRVTAESVSQLRREVRALERAGAGERILTAPAAGWFSPCTDGWEFLSPDNPDGLSPETVVGVLSAPERPSPGAGKLITGDSWLLAAFISAGDASRLAPGTELELALPAGDLPARIAGLRTGSDGRILAVFVCSRGLEAMADCRVAEARAVLSRREGLQLPEAALGRDEEGEYVLRRAGGFLRRESVTVLERRDGQALVRSEGLRPGSEILLPGQ